MLFCSCLAHPHSQAAAFSLQYLTLRDLPEDVSLLIGRALGKKDWPQHSVELTLGLRSAPYNSLVRTPSHGYKRAALCGEHAALGRHQRGWCRSPRSTARSQQKQCCDLFVTEDTSEQERSWTPSKGYWLQWDRKDLLSRSQWR